MEFKGAVEVDCWEAKRAVVNYNKRYKDIEDKIEQAQQRLDKVIAKERWLRSDLTEWDVIMACRERYCWPGDWENILASHGIITKSEGRFRVYHWAKGKELMDEVDSLTRISRSTFYVNPQQAYLISEYFLGIPKDE